MFVDVAALSFRVSWQNTTGRRPRSRKWTVSFFYSGGSNTLTIIYVDVSQRITVRPWIRSTANVTFSLVTRTGSVQHAMAAFRRLLWFDNSERTF